MSNEEKILAALETLASKVDKIEQGQAKLEQGQAKLEQGIEDLKEYAEETRAATNHLIEWADNVGNSVKLPLPRL